MRSYTSIYAWLFSLLLVASVGCGRDAAEDVCSETDPCPADQVCVEGACFDPGDGEDGGLEDAGDVDDVEDGFVDDAEVDGGPDQPDVIEVACETDRDCSAAQICAEDLCI